MNPTLPRTIANPATGDRIIFIQSPLLGDSDWLVFRCILPPHAAGAPLHSHNAMTETFLVESGALEIDLGGGRTRILRAGETMTIKPGTPHGFRNPLDTETRFVTTADPGADLELFLRTIYQLESDRISAARSLPSIALMLASVMARTDMVISGLPRWIQRACLILAAVIAKALGLEAIAPFTTRAQGAA
ncbi:cupin domain-containing protein [Novosphingobium sp. Chol11]|uniref:cupin domain-containing protein n=1 Tax=Novosphingobium sp. Chol11 TaxID=1385763 RepID=UPI0025E4A1A0|nr:cupin domain-containing protein [Novosphingobium sp. Chol11]